MTTLPTSLVSKDICECMCVCASSAFDVCRLQTQDKGSQILL